MSILLDELPLPDNLVWSNERDWFGVVRAIEPSVTGVPVIQTTLLTTGRPIKFASGGVWITKSALDAIDALVPGGPYTLTLHDGRTVDVSFDEPPMQVRQVSGDFRNPGADDLYEIVSLNFITTGAMNPPPEPEE